jgi:acylphosphatase
METCDWRFAGRGVVGELEGRGTLHQNQLDVTETIAWPVANVDELVRVRGIVQGIGFRPAVWNLARQHGLRVWVSNDGHGVTAHVSGAPSDVAAFTETQAGRLRAVGRPIPDDVRT